MRGALGERSFPESFTEPPSALAAPFSVWGKTISETFFLKKEIFISLLIDSSLCFVLSPQLQTARWTLISQGVGGCGRAYPRSRPFSGASWGAPLVPARKEPCRTARSGEPRIFKTFWQ